jgi:hypothetical protein
LNYNKLTMPILISSFNTSEIHIPAHKSSWQ